MVRMTKVRGFLGAVVAIVVLVVFIAIVARVLGWDIPLLNYNCRTSRPGATRLRSGAAPPP